MGGGDGQTDRHTQRTLLSHRQDKNISIFKKILLSKLMLLFLFFLSDFFLLYTFGCLLTKSCPKMDKQKPYCPSAIQPTPPDPSTLFCPIQPPFPSPLFFGGYPVTAMTHLKGEWEGCLYTFFKKKKSARIWESGFVGNFALDEICLLLFLRTGGGNGKRGF